MQQTILVCDSCRGVNPKHATARVAVSVNKAEPLEADFCPAHLAALLRMLRPRPAADGPPGVRRKPLPEKAALLRYLSTRTEPIRVSEIPNAVTGDDRPRLFTILHLVRDQQLVRTAGPHRKRTVVLTAQGRRELAKLEPAATAPAAKPEGGTLPTAAPRRPRGRPPKVVDRAARRTTRRPRRLSPRRGRR